MVLLLVLRHHPHGCGVPHVKVLQLLILYTRDTFCSADAALFDQCRDRSRVYALNCFHRSEEQITDCESYNMVIDAATLLETCIPFTYATRTRHHDVIIEVLITGWPL